MQRLKCACGGWIDETTDPANEDGYQGHTLRCFRCRARREAEEPFTDSKDRHGLLTYTTATTPPQSR